MTDVCAVSLSDQKVPEKECPHSIPLPPTIWILGCIMFLMNMSYVMVFSLSAVYLKSIMGVGGGLILAIEGVGEGLSFLAKLLSGVTSDYLRRRKVVIVIGYALQVMSRPILAISSSVGLVCSSMFIERLGNGIQATPRDALVSDVAPPFRKGSAFGLKRSLAYAGSFCGAGVGIFFMWMTDNNFKDVFLFATVPALIAFTILVLFVKDPSKKAHDGETQVPEKRRKHPIHFADFPRLGNKYWFLMLVVFMFMVARIGENALALHAHEDFSLSHGYIPIIMITYNAFSALFSFPLAKMSDRINRYLFLILGMGTLILADLTLAFAPNIWVFFLGVGFWGIQMGLVQSLFAALIADLAPRDLRGTAFGFYYIISAIGSFTAGFGGGLVAHNFGWPPTFIASGVMAAFSMIALLGLMAFHKHFTWARIPHHH